MTHKSDLKQTTKEHAYNMTVAFVCQNVFEAHSEPPLLGLTPNHNRAAFSRLPIT